MVYFRAMKLMRSDPELIYKRSLVRMLDSIATGYYVEDFDNGESGLI